MAAPLPTASNTFSFLLIRLRCIWPFLFRCSVWYSVAVPSLIFSLFNFFRFAFVRFSIVRCVNVIVILPSFAPGDIKKRLPHMSVPKHLKTWRANKLLNRKTYENHCLKMRITKKGKHIGEGVKSVQKRIQADSKQHFFLGEVIWSCVCNKVRNWIRSNAK